MDADDEHLNYDDHMDECLECGELYDDREAHQCAQVNPGQPVAEGIKDDDG